MAMVVVGTTMVGVVEGMVDADRLHPSVFTTCGQGTLTLLQGEPADIYSSVSNDHGSPNSGESCCRRIV